MATLIYCGTSPIGPTETQSLLVGRFHAIWAPPMYRYAAACPGDEVWLLWRNRSADAPVLLGKGQVRTTAEGKANWTNRTAPGIVGAAHSCGYSGPTNMAFLRLDNVDIPDDAIPVDGLGSIPSGLSTASPDQARILGKLAEVASL